MSVGIFLISTNKYKQFVQPLLTQIEDFFLPKRKKTIILFTDKQQDLDYGEDISMIQVDIPPYKFPQATLYRYKMFCSCERYVKKFSHLFYLDVDMGIADIINENELMCNGILAVRHPAFYITDGWGSPNNSPNSLSYISPGEQRHYYAGGFQGGAACEYLNAAKLLACMIHEDETHGVMAEWHDETFWNWYLNKGIKPHIPITELSPTYCMVENQRARKAWGIDNLPAKIIALDKNHQEIRS